MVHEMLWEILCQNVIFLIFPDYVCAKPAKTNLFTLYYRLSWHKENMWSAEGPGESLQYLCTWGPDQK